MLTSIIELKTRVDPQVDEDYDTEIDSDAETIVNKTYSDSDSHTISYQETNYDKEHYNWYEKEMIEHTMTKSGRQVKRKCPLNYEDL